MPKRQICGILLIRSRTPLYYYITNLEGDVIRLVDIYGQTAAMYKYDPFGNAIYATGSHAQINPLRYRGYYFDCETGLYYLQSRYYDPQVGRFINADSYASTGQGILGCNMFAYCNNNPITGYDPSGNRYVMRPDFGGVPQKEETPTINKVPSPEDAALERMRDEGFTLYKGVPLTLASSGGSAFTLGYIFMGAKGDATLLKHEYGHIVQSRILGIPGYISFIVIPSVIGYGIDKIVGLPTNTYYSLPWEYKADEFGGASHIYQSWAKPVADIYWVYSNIMTEWLF